MAIADVAQYAHLSETEMAALGAELDTIRRDIEESRGARDATYIRRTIAFQRTLEAAARLLIAASRSQGGVDRGDGGAGLRQMRREHGNRPQRGPRPVGLDERPRNPFHHLGMGHGRLVVAMALFLGHCWE